MQQQSKLLNIMVIKFVCFSKSLFKILKFYLLIFVRTLNYTIRLFLTFFYSRQHSESLILHVLQSLLLCSYLHLFLWIHSARLLMKLDNELALNLVLSINFNLSNMVFVKFLSILLTFFLLQLKRLRFLLFSPK